MAGSSTSPMRLDTAFWLQLPREVQYIKDQPPNKLNFGQSWESAVEQVLELCNDIFARNPGIKES